jgi:hypothetical protein
MAAVPRLLRIAFNALTVISLVLAILAAWLWARSFSHQDWVSVSGGLFHPHFPMFCSAKGSIYYVTGFDDRQSGGPWNASYMSRLTILPDIATAIATHRFAGFAFGAIDPQEKGAWGQYSVAIVLPDWALCGGFLLSPVSRSFRAIRKRRRPGRCAVCGYDLRATPDRCPECGTMPKGASVE